MIFSNMMLSRFGRTVTTASTSATFSRLNRSLSGITTSFNLPDPQLQKGDNVALTKIVATIGPTSEQMPALQYVVDQGMSIMRLNFSHATTEEVELRTTNLASCTGRHSSLTEPKTNNMRAILLDTKGPEIRSGKLKNDDSGHETILLEEGKSIILDTSDARRDEGGTVESLYIDYQGLVQALEVGSKVLLDDGAVVLTVTGFDGDNKVTCTIDNSGDLRSRAGVNLPGANTSDLPAMSDKDKVDIKYGMTKDIDYVAASFVQNAQGVEEIRSHLQKCKDELGDDVWPTDQPLPLIISKIESLSGLSNFDAILAASDGIMVARGDLGVEVPLVQVGNAQKEMVAACRAVGKPVIVATQMLESMAKQSPRPTRAEVTDVTNAVYDGADCVMLSGETAKGKYPSQSVQTMNNIVKSAEQYYASQQNDNTSSNSIIPSPTAFMATISRDNASDMAIAKAAVTAVETHPDAKAILVLSDKLTTIPALCSSFRPTSAPILVSVSSSKLARQLVLYRGIYPIHSDIISEEDALNDAKTMGLVQEGDVVVVVTDTTDHNAALQFATVV
mmetsp:Transcript_38675/g.44164  ORF Transcript_38675/g.44164 Transcript_38675/m.44164 type:complete len:561 (-) Transcript_38675:105-1787(-)